MKGLDDLTLLRVRSADHVATVTMAAPPVNAQNRVFREEMIRVFDVLGADADTRVIVLTGEGRAFSAGADLTERTAIAGEAGGYSRHNRLVRAAFDVIMECPKPVIAAVNGAAIGAGCVMALVCDILVVAEEAFLSMTEVDYGMAGGVRHVLRAFSPSDARLMIYTARRISGPELYRMNVASACVPRERLLDEATAIASKIARKVPLAVVAAKRSFGLTEEMPLRDGYRYEQTQTALLAETEDTKEALAAFREKRTPVFKGR
ncbi:enoyl-CoA hydratase/isomerase family protein [Novosphingobium sp. Rr 2-17]|uniref:enoyl-CoA hydratase/isomerase family protein n=1 Tax=Novosphingobium sp. Rr 2-17 TaxID=555793 RepID=UPI0002698EA8|nr:enoyl-CoA hydratase/isomerase family protein [Novosphingobium sp. Rr 2-17]EIZ80081.1 enoyl-CoA hydratase/isomerase family protein [Novosphingobium sp. Rr 2-17]